MNCTHCKANCSGYLCNECDNKLLEYDLLEAKVKAWRKVARQMYTAIKVNHLEKSLPKLDYHNIIQGISEATDFDDMG